MSEDKSSKWVPEYPQDLHPDVVGECQSAWANGRPWTHLQVLRKGVDDSSGASCAWPGGCTKKVEAVQYTSSFGNAEFYCADHAVAREEMDVILFDSEPRKPPELTPDDREFIRRLLTKKRRRTERDEEENLE